MSNAGRASAARGLGALRLPADSGEWDEEPRDVSVNAETLPMHTSLPCDARHENEPSVLQNREKFRVRDLEICVLTNTRMSRASLACGGGHFYDSSRLQRQLTPLAHHAVSNGFLLFFELCVGFGALPLHGEHVLVHQPPALYHSARLPLLRVPILPKRSQTHVTL
jgi:hypothetical protein